VGPVSVLVPELRSVDGFRAAVAIGAAVLMFRFRVGLLAVLAAAIAVGLAAWWLAGPA